MKDFIIDFKSELFDDLRDRIRRVRLPHFEQARGWSLGTPDSVLAQVLNDWGNYDWAPQQAYLNQFPQFLCEIDGVTIHFFHIKSPRPGAVPVLMAHGWPDSFLRYSKTFPLLTDYDLVVPSIPGFGFGSLPAKGFVNNADTAELWHKLMTQILGYREFVATGGDMGRGVLFYLASNHPECVMGLHLTDVGYAASIVASPDSELSPEFLQYKREASEWMHLQGAYIAIQGTKPYSLGYGLCDSPAGMAGWLTEKYHDWSDPAHFTQADLLANLTLYWMTGCAASSVTAYHGNSFTLPPLGKISAPVAIARFPHDILPVPRKWIEDNFNLVRYTEMPYGGHFTAMEAPEPFAADLKAFITELGR